MSTETPLSWDEVKEEAEAALKRGELSPYWYRYIARLCDQGEKAWDEIATLRGEIEVIDNAIKRSLGSKGDS